MSDAGAAPEPGALKTQLSFFSIQKALKHSGDLTNSDSVWKDSLKATWTRVEGKPFGTIKIPSAFCPERCWLSSSNWPHVGGQLTTEHKAAFRHRVRTGSLPDCRCLCTLHPALCSGPSSSALPPHPVTVTSKGRDGDRLVLQAPAEPPV